MEAIRYDNNIKICICVNKCIKHTHIVLLILWINMFNGTNVFIQNILYLFF